jgi:mutator protein MutT
MDFVLPVVVCSVVKDGKVLFIRRRGKTFAGLLSLPGGKIDFGETLERAAERELEEETGVRARFVKHLATIPEHIVEDGRVIKHMVIQLCSMEHLGQSGQGEFDPEWISLEDMDSRKQEITPSDYLMIKRILLEGNHRGHHSVIERKGSGYVQREFRGI